jgi:hypothetical protein
MIVMAETSQGRAARGARAHRSRTGAVRPRRIPGLFDLAVVVGPDGGLTTAQWPDRSLTGTELADVVRAAGGGGLDVRVLATPDAQSLPTVAAMARELGRDVMVAPAGSELRLMPTVAPSSRSAGPLAGGDHSRQEETSDDGDLVPVDLVTGCPVDWVIVQPSGQPVAPYGWFELAGGLVLARAGTVLLPLPGGGLALATREDFVRRRCAIADLRPSHADLLTVAVGVHSGDFVVGDYSGRTTRCDGRELAAALASLPLYRAELRLCLSWPGPAEERRRLRHNVVELADTTGATVWAPAEGARLAFLEGCRDLCAVGPGNEPARWELYGGDDREAFQSDVDGRLVPAGGVVTASYRGVPLVSVLPTRQQRSVARYQRLRPIEGVFRADLAVLADGRFALRYRDGSLVAAGNEQLRQLLEQAGWRGADLVLLSPIPHERSAGARRHAQILSNYLGCSITLDEPPATAPGGAAPPRLEPALNRTGTAVANEPLPPPPMGASDEPDAGGEPEAARGPSPRPLAAQAADPTPARADTGGAYLVDADSGTGGLPGTTTPSRFIDGPRLMLAARSAPRHAVTWLPSQPHVNEEEFQLYVECVDDPGGAAAKGIACPDLFLLGHLDLARLAARIRDGYILQLRVAAGGAVDVAASEADPPAALAPALNDNDVYLLPGGWLDRSRLVAALRVVQGGQILPQNRFVDAPVNLKSQGGAHGIPGLPNQVERWPRGRVRTAVTRYIMVRENDPDGLGAYQQLHPRRPPAVSGGRLLQVRVGNGRAIDVAATASALAGLTAVRTNVAQLLADGIDVLLPVVSYQSTVIEQEFRADNGDWRRISASRRRTLHGWTPKNGG